MDERDFGNDDYLDSAGEEADLSAMEAHEEARAAREAADLLIAFPDVEVQLVGEDGNAFAIIGRVSRALKRAGYGAEATAFTKEAMDQPSYDALLQLVMRTVNVS